MSDLGSEIAGFYQGRSVFITGASGFVGKVLVEKLLRSCPGVANVYILLRPKRGNNINQRLEEILKAELFDTIRKTRPGALSKVIPIHGDITTPGLGISPEDADVLIENVSVVIHSAATVRFDEPLKFAVQQNIVGTKATVEFSKRMTKLAAIIYVSTAYSNCPRKEITEKLYPAPINPYKLIELTQWMDSDVMDKITPHLIGDWPNTYTFTKALAEHVFTDLTVNLPSSIIRPSIVCASWKEPVPGWVDNLNGPTGMMAGVGKGLIRCLYCNPKHVTDLIPVDILVNLIVTLGWRTATSGRCKEPMIYHSCSSSKNPITWGYWQEAFVGYTNTTPFRQVFWYPAGSLITSKWRFKILIELYHMLPARIFDFLAVISGKKPFLLRVQEKFWRNFSIMQYFATQEWKFSCDNTTALQEALTSRDRHLFNFDITVVQWTQYIATYFNGIKTFILKENPKEPSNLKRMYYIYKGMHIVKYLLLLKFFQLIFPHFRALLNSVCPYIPSYVHPYLSIQS